MHLFGKKCLLLHFDLFSRRFGYFGIEDKFIEVVILCDSLATLLVALTTKSWICHKSNWASTFLQQSIKLHHKLIN